LHVNSPEFSEQNQEIIQIFFDIDDAMLLSSNRQEVNSVDLSISGTASRFPWTCDPPLSTSALSVRNPISRHWYGF
jgi:hypothetical protein